MTMSLVFRAAAAIPLLAATACMYGFEPALDGSGRVVSESRTAGDFDRVAVEDDFDVTITVGPAASVQVTGDDNLLPFVKTEVRGRTLHVERTRRLDPTGDIRVTVATPALSGLSSSGSSDVRASDVRATTFAASVSGSGHVVADGDFGDLDASVSGSGSTRLRGTAGAIDASVSGSGDLDLAEVVGRSARVRVSGSGNVVVHVVETLNAAVSGSGDVRYAGNPRVESSVSGSGAVRPASRR
jgi:hypothetical protein